MNLSDFCQEWFSHDKTALMTLQALHTRPRSPRSLTLNPAVLQTTVEKEVPVEDDESTDKATDEKDADDTAEEAKEEEEKPDDEKEGECCTRFTAVCKLPTWAWQQCVGCQAQPGSSSARLLDSWRLCTCKFTGQ